MQSPEILVNFIGSVAVREGEEGQNFNDALSLVCGVARNRPEVVIHAPQLTDRPERLMDAEALCGFPLMVVEEGGRLTYDLVVQRDEGNEPGKIIPKEESEELFNRLELDVNAFLAEVQEGDRDTVEEALGELAKKYPELGSLPPGLEALIDWISRRKVSVDGRDLKIQISGPINTGLNVYVRNEGGGLERGVVLQNERMLSIHAGMILARSMFEAKAIRDVTERLGVSPRSIVCSFDEPSFDMFDKDGGPRRETAQKVYGQLWENPAFPYKRMVHVCGSLEPWLLKYVDLLNWDVWARGELVKGHGEAIREFMERGGNLVLGVVPTIPAEVIELAGGEDNLTSSETWLDIIAKCTKRVDDVLKILKEEGIPREFALKNVQISPQCGLGGWSNHPHGRIYSILAYGMTLNVAQRVGGFMIEETNP